MGRKEEIAAWQKRLEDNFSHHDVVGGSLLPTIMEMERACGKQYVHGYKGHRVLADAFLDFFAITLNDVAVRVTNHGWPKAMPYYSTCLASFLTLFRSMRAAEMVAVSGYALDGYALLRNAKEQSLCLGAIAAGLSSFPALLGVKGMPTGRQWTPAEHDQALRKRETEENRIRSHMVGKDSGLATDQIEELKHWERLFNYQVHGSRFTFVQASEWLIDPTKPFSIGPLPNERDLALYMNRFSEISWMIHRALTFLQRADAPFDAEWIRKWEILDESTRTMILGLDQIGKKIARVFEAMIDTKFPFGPSTVYVERS